MDDSTDDSIDIPIYSERKTHHMNCSSEIKFFILIMIIGIILIILHSIKVI